MKTNTSDTPRMFRSLPLPHPLLFVLLLVIPSGCFTSSLWSKHIVDVESSPKLVGLFDQFSVSSRNQRICIHYKTAGNTDQQYSLLIHGGPGYKLDNAKDLLQNDNEVRISSIIVNIQEYKPLNDHVRKQVVVYFSWDLPDANIAFVRDENGTAFGKGHGYHPGIELTLDEEDLVKKIIQDKWKARFGADLDSGLCPIAWIDRQGDVIAPSAEDASGRNPSADDVLGIIAEIMPPAKGFRYVRLQYNVKKYTNFATHKSFDPDDKPRVLKNTDNDAYFYLFGAIVRNGLIWQNEIIGTVVHSGSCSVESPEWILLPAKGIPSSIYENNSEEQRTFKYPLLTRVLGSPFAVGLDILTFPVQLFIIEDFRKYFSVDSPGRTK